jgi:hypothetical protein
VLATSRLSSLRRPRILTLGLAVAAVLCAFVASVGPSKHLQTRFSWPPTSLPSSTPQRLWYAPLLLARHEPASIDVRVPCSLPPRLDGRSGQATVLATARDPQQVGAFALVRLGKRVSVLVGSDRIDELALDGAGGPDCTYLLRFGAGKWTRTGGPGGDTKAGDLGTMPVVDGLFSELDLEAGKAPSIEVTTHVYGSKSKTWQIVLWSLAALAALASLTLVAVQTGSRPSVGAALDTTSRGLRHTRLADAVVLIVLGGWWLLGPAFFDDGWRLATLENFSAFGQFSTYYSSFGVGASLDWLQWIEHHVFGDTRVLLFLRLPALLSLAVTWALCRWIFARTVTSGSAASRWALACGFLVGALAWGMTLRPEPLVTLLVTAVFACTILFVERETVAPLAVAAVLALLAFLAHPAGIVALAPLLAILPQLWSWTRTRWTTVATIVLAVAALFLILGLVGSDLQQRRADISSLRTYGDQIAGWRDELNRYDLLSRSPYGPPLRRGWAALAVLSIAGFLFRRRSQEARPRLGLPATTLGLSLLLFVITPSKLPWHFGALIGFAALAIAAETARLREDCKESRGWELRPLIAIGAAMAAAGWAWFPRNSWGDLDLRTLDWTIGIERHVTLAKLAGFVPLALLAALLVLGRDRRTGRAAWRTAIWSAPLVAVPLLVFTIAMFAADAAKTDSWTLPRQNLQSMGGELRCGFADDTFAPRLTSMHSVAPDGALPTGLAAGAAAAPQTPVRNVRRFLLGPAAPRSGWYARTPGPVGVFVSGAPGTPIELEWGRRTGNRIRPVARHGLDALPADDARPDLVYWRFVPLDSLPQAPAGAEAIRLHLAGGGPVAVTAPVRYESTRLRDLLEVRSPSLALPNLLTYVPCVQQPRLGGVAEPPKAILAFRNSTWPLGTGTSPFDGITGVYQLVRLPLTQSAHQPNEVAVYVVDQRIDGGQLVPPEESAGS